MSRARSAVVLRVRPRTAARGRRLQVGLLSGLGMALLAVTLLAVAVGEQPIPPLAVAAMLLQWLPVHPPHTWSDVEWIIVTQIRLPRVITGVFVGGALAVAGAAFQALFRNPLADPGIVGTSAGAGMGAMIAFVLPVQGTWLGFGLVPLAAFAGAMAATLLVYLLARSGNSVPATTLLLSGFAVSAVLNAGSALVETLSDRLREMYVWLLGSLDNNTGEPLLVAAPLLVVGVGILIVLAGDINVLVLGDEQAQFLGLNVTQRRITILLVGALLTSVAVALGGVIALVGLLVPHIARLLVGPNHRVLLPASFFAGAIFLVIVDTIARMALGGQELPIGLITALVGAPWFLLLLRRSRGAYVL
ncbi:MAG TPA: iron ABC transporter permease [Chloroflexota bacterium]|nr:iron ABC transporter permease [Chloroflexota bacterium]